MPLVLARSTRAEDAHLKYMRNAVAAQHRAQRLTFDSRAAAEIEYKQKANWERNIKRPLLPQPRAQDGWSTPEWDATRACWLAYSINDTTKWICWDTFSEKWIDITDFDKNCSSPSSGSGSGSGPGSGSERSKSERVSPSNTDLAERSDNPGPSKSRFTFRAVAHSIMKVWALRKVEDSETQDIEHENYFAFKTEKESKKSSST